MFGRSKERLHGVWKESGEILECDWKHSGWCFGGVEVNMEFTMNYFLYNQACF